MKFIELLGFGSPDVLRVSDGPELSPPAANEVIVRVLAAGVNRPDLLQRQGKYPPPPEASPILGLEVAGEVAQAGSESKWKPGDRICALVPGGGYAEYCKVPSVQCLPVPKGLSMVEAAALPETFFTVWANLFQIGQLQAGERVLVHGGSSGIGTTAIQLVKAFGSEVWVTAGSKKKCDACLQLGADGVINYREQDFVVEVNRLTSGKGVHLVLDMVGGEYTSRNIECLATGGRLIQIAAQAGAEVQVNLLKIMKKRITLTGSTLRPRSVTDKGKIARELDEKVWPLFAKGQVKPCIDRVFQFKDVAEAHRYLESGENIGKVVLDLTNVKEL